MKAARSKVIAGRKGIEWVMQGAVAGRSNEFLVYLDGAKVADIHTGIAMNIGEVKVLASEGV